MEELQVLTPELPVMVDARALRAHQQALLAVSAPLGLQHRSGAGLKGDPAPQVYGDRNHVSTGLSNMRGHGGIILFNFSISLRVTAK